MEAGPRVQSQPSPSTRSQKAARRRGPDLPLDRPAARAPSAQPPPLNCRLCISGYPIYTHAQDIIDVFSKFGAVKIENCSSKLTTLSYPTAECARAAIAANKRVHIYGHYLAVKPCTGKEAEENRPPSQPPTPKREFPRSKQKGMIIEPKKIDLSGDFHNQLDNILAAVRLNQEDVKSLGQLYTDLEVALQAQWPGCKAVPFGSITTGLGIKTSDADCFINIPGKFRVPNGNYVNKAKRVLTQHPGKFAEMLAIPRANTPIVKLFHIPTETNCDVTFKTPLGAQNSRLVAFLLHADPRLLPMAVMIKYWAKVHDLSGTGKLTNYALTLMIIFYLQQPPMSILPPVVWLQRDPADAYVVDYWNTGFMNDPKNLPPSSNTSSISELLGGFFEFYSMFDFEEMVICPYLGVPIKKDTFKEVVNVPAEFERYKNNVLKNYVLPMRFQTSICVQDPFEQCHNVASTITSKLALDIKAFFKFAANAYEKEKLNSCQEFLKIILLQRPKLVRGKSHPEFRINLFPRVINTIISLAWKNVVRDIALVMFDKILKIPLDKVEEKPNPDTKKEKEKFSGVLTKPVWKRKSFSKVYSNVVMSFEEKQGRITEEILVTEKQEININFQLILTYSHDPKNAVISIKFCSGDLGIFREFGKFFISVMHNWIIELLKPHSVPNNRDTAAKIAEILETDNNEVDGDSDSDDDDEILIVPKPNHVNENQMTNNAEETLPLNTGDKLTVNSVGTTTETLTNNTEESLTKDVESLTINAETQSANECSLVKNDETLLNAAHNDTIKDDASDVTLACAFK